LVAVVAKKATDALAARLLAWAAPVVVIDSQGPMCGVVGAATNGAATALKPELRLIGTLIKSEQTAASAMVFGDPPLVLVLRLPMSSLDVRTGDT
jgi:hypothetical protein